MARWNRRAGRRPTTGSSRASSGRSSDTARTRWRFSARHTRRRRRTTCSGSSPGRWGPTTSTTAPACVTSPRRGRFPTGWAGRPRRTAWPTSGRRTQSWSSTDGLVLDLLCAAVLDAGGVDRSFVEARTSGTDQFIDELAALDRAALAEAAGVDRDAVERVAETISDADGMAAIVGTGIETDEREPSAADSLLNLLLLTGNVGRPGAGLHVFRGLSNEQGATDAGCVPDRLPGHQPLDDPEARTRIEREWGVAPPETPGRTAHELLAAFGSEIHCALVVGENPGVSKRDPDWIEDRLGGLDTLAVVELTESETTRHADVVLPAAAAAEKRGTMTNLDRRIQPLQPVREPPASARTDFEILRTIGAEFGEFDYDDLEDAFAELCAVAPSYRGIEYPEPGEQGARWPAGSGRVLYRETFRTPDGRAPLVSPAHRPESTPSSGLELVVGGRATDASSAGEEGQVRLPPADAADRDVDDGDQIQVATDDAAVEACT
ncbi:hypothetical protein BRC69_05400 [Halobacteriales archaeon QH_6_66_25]|nr:MAG: hypothetical protein BRC69_05400 [Halobacteriales archaeon QH_6_66_25]